MASLRDMQMSLTPAHLHLNADEGLPRDAVLAVTGYGRTWKRQKNTQEERRNLMGAGYRTHQGESRR